MPLRPKHFALLRDLAEHARRLITREERKPRNPAVWSQKSACSPSFQPSVLSPQHSMLVRRETELVQAYLPIMEAFGQLCRQPGGEQVIALLGRYAPTWQVQTPALLDDTEIEALQHKVQGATRERMLREMAQALEALTTEQPLLWGGLAAS